ncbi:MAG: hypothetical protein WCT10_04000 [Patescibacteria group bacterium]|jgi:hypothetical protein
MPFALLSKEAKQILALAQQIRQEEMKANSKRTGKTYWYSLEEAARRRGYKLTRVGSMTCSGGTTQRPQKARTTFLERLRRILFGHKK